MLILLKHNTNTIQCVGSNQPFHKKKFKMSVDIVEFLKKKFMVELEEAEEEYQFPPHVIPLLPYFQQIQDVLKETTSITPLKPIRIMKGCQRCIDRMHSQPGGAHNKNEPGNFFTRERERSRARTLLATLYRRYGFYGKQKGS